MKILICFNKDGLTRDILLKHPPAVNIIRQKIHLCHGIPFPSSVTLKQLFPELDETGDGVIAVTRSWKGKKAARAVCSLTSLVNSRLPPDNIINVEVDQKQGGINPDNRSHKGYLAHLCRLVTNRVQNLVNASIEADPEIKSKKKMVQEIYAESLMHLALLRQITPCEDNENVEKIKEFLIAGEINDNDFDV